MSNASSELSQEVSMMIDVTDHVGDNDDDCEYEDHDVFDATDETQTLEQSKRLMSVDSQPPNLISPSAASANQ